MADSFTAFEAIPTRARVVLGSTGAALVAADCDTVSVYVYDLSSDFPEDPVYQLLDDDPANYLGGATTDGVFTYNVDFTISAKDTFTRYKGHRFLIRAIFETNDEGPLPVEHYCDISL